MTAADARARTAAAADAPPEQVSAAILMWREAIGAAADRGLTSVRETKLPATRGTIPPGAMREALLALVADGFMVNSVETAGGGVTVVS
ncbi:MAG TPA: hypothetical protein VD866_27205, partial [Urbifossiella sp.]|nr:hypothetical protein [Urbifossiella sp.]